MRSIEDIATRLSQALPPQVGPLRDELHANFRAILQSQLARLELVPREEFEAARAMLAHTRAKLDDMEQRMAMLEAQAER
ncbi:accessory factor UbiK family protein [Salinisphaera sp. T31B1]|uniref:accessory factor UbiK family protein n=1 Tax=Salinisphaera sp. T31B1 TaxID=727963 RepID=UPI003342C300